MGFFDNLKIDSKAEQETNRAPVSNNMYGPVDSGAYEAVIEMAYGDVSKGGAANVNFVFKLANGREYKETIYVSNRKGETFYTDKRTGKPADMPGFTTVKAISLLSIGEEFTDLEPEEKMVKIYDYAQRKEVPQSKPVFMSLLGEKVVLGIHKIIEDKNIKNDRGDYVPSGETREVNTINKVFRDGDHLTVPEITAGITTAEYYDAWVESNTGKVINKAKGVSEGSSALAATAPKAESSPKSLFAK